MGHSPRVTPKITVSPAATGTATTRGRPSLKLDEMQTSAHQASRIFAPRHPPACGCDANPPSSLAVLQPSRAGAECPDDPDPAGLLNSVLFEAPATVMHRLESPPGSF
jgi:hypothetical protein